VATLLPNNTLQGVQFFLFVKSRDFWHIDWNINRPLNIVISSLKSANHKEFQLDTNKSLNYFKRNLEVCNQAVLIPSLGMFILIITIIYCDIIRKLLWLLLISFQLEPIKKDLTEKRSRGNQRNSIRNNFKQLSEKNSPKDLDEDVTQQLNGSFGLFIIFDWPEERIQAMVWAAVGHSICAL